MKTIKANKHIIYVINRYTLDIKQYCKLTIKHPDLKVLISILNNNLSYENRLLYVEFTEQYTKDNDVITIIKNDLIKDEDKL